MKSASAEHFRRASREAVLRMTAEERIARSHAIAECMLSVFAAANGLSLDEARAVQQARVEAARRAAHPHPREG
jgi:hypothetical protein